MPSATSRAAAVCAALLATAAAAAAGLPTEVAAALRRAEIAPESVGIVVRELRPGARDLVAMNAERPLNPASLTKLVTTLAALDVLGPAWRWSTPVWLDGTVRDGVLDGTLAIRGSGDPTLGADRLRQLFARVQQLGVRTIAADIVLDDGAFAPDPAGAADFDGAPARPYNVRAAALVFHHKAVGYSFVPDAAAGIARVVAEPALGGAVASVPLSDGPCGDWQAGLGAEPAAGGVRFGGAFPLACGEQSWWFADPDPATYNARLAAALWAGIGGRLDGRVRDGAAPASAPSFVLASAPLADVVRDINKNSNNTMAQQLFLTLDLVRHPDAPATIDGARDALRAWLEARFGALAAEAAIDNGSGLSRRTRLSPRLFAALLQWAWDSPLMPEFAASLPIHGVDGTLRRADAAARGRAHLKTGSLRDVAALAGYVDATSGRRLLLVAIVQHPNAAAARPALDALLRWTLER